jgi:hypothetical protein
LASTGQKRMHVGFLWKNVDEKDNLDQMNLDGVMM